MSPVGVAGALAGGDPGRGRNFPQQRPVAGCTRSGSSEKRDGGAVPPAGPMRVTGGEFRSRPLQMPKGPVIRPTLDHVRQAMFNLIGPRIEGLKVLDLFSGT